LIASETAKEILESGNAFQYLYETWKLLHFGDEFVGKVLIMTIPQALIKDSKGIHVCVIGTSGTGKSNCQDTALLLLPENKKFDGIVTPQALFYSDKFIKKNSIVSIDDIVWGDELGVNVKRITGKFPNAVSKISVSSGEGTHEKCPPGLIFWVSCVEFQADEQIRDRFIIVETDNSYEHVEEVINTLKKQDAKNCKSVRDLQKEIDICKNIIQMICEQDYDVEIPFAEQIVGDFASTRAYKMFSDIIKSFAVFRYPIRRDLDSGRLIATEQDFYDAVELYNSIGGISRDKLSSSEKNVINAIRDLGGAATYTEIGQHIGIEYQVVRNILLGRDPKNPQKNNGLLAKCNGKLVIDGYPKKVRIVSDMVGIQKITLNTSKSISGELATT
jgi:hypothetical protein